MDVAQHLFLTWLPSLWNGELPQHYARMRAPGHPHKYVTIHAPLTARELGRHWDGRVTLAASLVTSTGQSRVAALDLDRGGLDGVRAVLRSAEHGGYQAFGYAVHGGKDGHDGGHVWLFFDQLCVPVRLRALADQLARAAHVEDAETYPTRKSLRLPFGLHRTAHQHGRLLLQSGELFQLDDSLQRRAALHAVVTLPTNPVALVPTFPPLPPPQQAARRSHHDRTSAQFNHGTDLLALLIAAGARVARPLAHGGVLLHCPCRQHRHGDTTPSLEVRPSTTPARYGRWIALGYSPTCRFYVERGQIVDAFRAGSLLRANDDPSLSVVEQA